MVDHDSPFPTPPPPAHTEHIKQPGINPPQMELSIAHSLLRLPTVYQECETFWTAYRLISVVTNSDLCDTARNFSLLFVKLLDFCD